MVDRPVHAFSADTNERSAAAGSAVPRRLSSTMWLMGMVALVAGCSGSNVDASPETSSGEPVVVGQHASDNPGSVNTFWIEGPEGLIVIDGQRVPSDADDAVSAIEETGQPVAAILITHAHPDHVGGLGALRDEYPHAPIYATEAVLTFMRDDPLGLYELTREGLDEYPDEMTYPDEVIEPDQRLELGGMSLEVAEFGPAESEAMTVYYEPESGALFTGDLINTRGTPALIEGNTCGWLADLDGLRDTFPDVRTIYPGHGAPGDPDGLIHEQQAYLDDFRGLVELAIDDSSQKGTNVSPAELESIGAKLVRRYPGYDDQRVASLPAEVLLDLNVNAVADELVAERADKQTGGCT